MTDARRETMLGASVGAALRGGVRALGAPSDVASLSVFRVTLGLLVTCSSIRFLAFGWVDQMFVAPKMFFTYWGFGWVQPLSAPWMYGIFVATSVLGLCLAAGLFYRVVTIALFVLFTYVQLIDVTSWLNHYYLVSLLLALAAVMPLGRAWSLDAWRRPERRLAVFPSWCTYLLRFQIGVVYFYAGVAKLSTDWLVHAQPLNIWLSSRSDIPLLGALFDARAVAFAFAWGGFLYDLTIAFFLLARRTRPYAFAVVIGFHATVGMLFPIGMFPWVMTLSALVFFSPSWPRVLRARITRQTTHPPMLSVPFSSRASSFRLRSPMALAIGAYCVLQVLMPLRHHLYGGNVHWHEQGMRFSWKVMVREKNGSVTYCVSSRAAGRSVYVSPRRYLDARQEREMAGQPDLVLQLARKIAGDYRARGWSDVEVRAEALISLNGRPAAFMIDPDVDLAREHDGLARATWITGEPLGPPVHLKPLWSTNAWRSLASR